MRTTRATLAMSMLAALALAGCTSDGAEPDEGDGASASAGLEGSIPESGWWCRMFDEELVASATGGQTDRAREVLRKNDEEGWQCEVVLPVDGGPETEPVLTLTIDVDAPEQSDTWRAEAQEAGAEPGPDFLGESYVYPGTAVALLPCEAPPSSPEAGTPVPYVVSVVAHGDAGQELTEELVDPVRRTVVDLDKATGCSPKQAGTPDDASATTGG